MAQAVLTCSCEHVLLRLARTCPGCTDRQVLLLYSLFRRYSLCIEALSLCVTTVTCVYGGLGLWETTIRCINTAYSFSNA
jgi:hypothetical protein